MNTLTKQKLIALNQKFYEQIAPEFSSSRSHLQPGFSKIWQYLNLTSEAKILDLGCGNGRFVQSIQNNLSKFNYLGIDGNQVLINLAQNQYQSPTCNFKKLDLRQFIANIAEKYHLITLFALLH